MVAIEIPASQLERHTRMTSCHSQDESAYQQKTRQAGTAKSVATATQRKETGRSVKGKASACAVSGEKYYTPDELELVKAMDEFKNRTGVRFPTLTDTLAVLKQLGYQKVGVSA